MVYKINFKQILRNFYNSSILLIFGVIGYFMFNTQGSSTLFIILISIQFIPVFFLLIDYLINSNYEIFISTNSIKVDKQVISKDEISKLEVFACPSIFRSGNFQIFPFESFHYVKISTTKGIFYISSISNKDLNTSIKKHSIFAGKIDPNKGGWLKNGRFFNSIYLQQKINI